MKFQFEASQEHQVEAIEAVCALFEGQPRLDAAASLRLGQEMGAIGNRLDLDDSAILANVRRIQELSGLPRDDALHTLPLPSATSDPKADQASGAFYNFSVEMETGTGKTYVYIRTALELFQRYGFRKYIVVVPSVAIREGVLKDLEMTRSHFREIFGSLPYRWYVYRSTTLSPVRQFALSDSIELMVMTIDSFNKASNVIRQPTDRLQGETPIDLVRQTRPILILDEPQNMESELSIEALGGLNPLFALRYSATHRNPYNAIYRLTPFDAYRQGLVKRIEVASVVEESDESQPYIRVERIDPGRSSVSARVAVHKLMRTGAVKEAVVTVRSGDSLEVKAGGRAEYHGYDVDEVSAGGGYVRFANNVEVSVGDSIGTDRESLFAAQIAYTIEEHFRKQERYESLGVKVLSLFFIDRVSNYVGDEPVIRRLFAESFERLRNGRQRWEALEPSVVQAGYFAERRRRGGTTEYVDSRSGATKEDEGAFELIMRDKERLLSLEEPVAFIFTHSALREGWDNPNVFQICTLNQTTSEVKKRQEVGRGVRLCRDQSGDRVFDERVNVLTVVANESYEHYVGQLQAEIEADYGPEGTPPRPANARKRGVARLRKEYTLRPEFKELWERIKHKTRYAVRIDTEGLIADVLPDVDKIRVRAPRVAIQKAEVRLGDDNVFEALQMSSAKTVIDLVGRYPLPNLVAIMGALMENTSPPVRLTRMTLLEICRRTANKEAAVTNPFDFATEVVRVVKERLADHLVAGIQYEKLNEWYEMTQLEPEIESWETYLEPAKRSVYDHVIYDSQIEREFVQGLERMDQVKMYLKLPGWFSVDTPVGTYNPDWAIVMEDRDVHGTPTGKPLLYLVRETKAATWRTALRPSERRKIACGRRHFKDALGVDYKVVTAASELP